MPPAFFTSRRKQVELLCGVVIAIALPGCGGSSAGSPTITLYNSQHEQTTAALISAFTKRTGIKVRVLNNSEDVLTAQLVQEGSRSPADVFYAENSNWLQQLANRGLLAKVDAATLAGVPGRDSASGGDWVGVSARLSSIVYNPSKVSAAQLPKSVLGLADPQWKGKLELAPAETDFWPIVSSIARSRGAPAAEAFLKSLKANAGSNDNVPDNETVVRDVSQGTADLALINQYYFYRLQAELGKGSVHGALAYFAPGDPGYVEDVSGAAVLKASQHQAAAQRFLAFLTGRSGQTLLAQSQSFEYPIHQGVAPNPALPPLGRFKPSSFTPNELGTGLDAERLLRAAGLI